MTVDTRSAVTRSAREAAITPGAGRGTAGSQDVRILVVDDERSLLNALTESLSLQGYQVLGFDAPEDALAALRAGAWDVLITDMMMPGVDGMALLRAALQIDAELVCLVITGHGSVDAAVEAMKSGASDFILKPFQASTLVSTISRALAVRRLRRERESLFNSLQQRTSELLAANRELEAFAHSVSHDLRAPLAAIMGFSDLLIERGAELDAARAKHLNGRICANARHMMATMDNLLKLGQASRGELRISTIDLSAMAAEIVAELALGASERRVQVDIAPGLSARGDPGLVRTALENLLGNAWKYTAGRSEACIQVGAEAEPGSGDQVFLVRDNGAGFDMSAAGRLFQPFHRLHSSTEFPGTGIGLSIVRRVVERHAGRIWADAAPGKGATFRFTLGKAGSSGEARDSSGATE